LSPPCPLSELIDTFFIVIHKKPLIFLHWYHHVTVLLYCWHAYVTKAPTGLFFIVMNYGVHSIMYGYYFLMAMKLKPSWMNAMVITVAQISQMIVGVIVTALGFYYAAQAKANNQKCLTEPRNNFAALIMYGSYLFLFMEFFLARYFGIKRTTGLKEKKKAA
jgi:elongation of very long chain fatty acids protein 6